MIFRQSAERANLSRGRDAKPGVSDREIAQPPAWLIAESFSRAYGGCLMKKLFPVPASHPVAITAVTLASPAAHRLIPAVAKK